MNAVLEAARAEREALLAPIADKLAALDEIQRIAESSLNGGGSEVASRAVAVASASVAQRPSRPAPTKPAKLLPAKTASSGVGRDGLSKQAQAALEKVRAAGATPLSRGEVGASASVMQTLVKRNLVEGIGATVARRYRAMYPEDSATAGSGPSIIGAAAKSSAATIGAHETTGELPAGPRRVLRARILDHLSRRRLNEQSLADHLNAEREHVADLLGKLLTDELVVLGPDGCYSVPA